MKYLYFISWNDPRVPFRKFSQIKLTVLQRLSVYFAIKIIDKDVLMLYPVRFRSHVELDGDQKCVGTWLRSH